MHYQNGCAILTEVHYQNGSVSLTEVQYQNGSVSLTEVQYQNVCVSLTEVHYQNGSVSLTEVQYQNGSVSLTEVHYQNGNIKLNQSVSAVYVGNPLVFVFHCFIEVAVIRLSTVSVLPEVSDACNLHSHDESLRLCRLPGVQSILSCYR